MCGLVAVHGSHPVEKARLDRAIDTLRRRGPDGRGLFVSPDGCTALGHARLALVDPSGGAQPLASESGDVVAVVNGEFYDAGDALRRRLEARGHRFGSRSDSELLVHLYEDQGERAIEELRGEFAFVLWDGVRQRIVAGRDRLGIRPLLYAPLPGGGLAFASTLAALLELGVPRRWDRASLFQAASVQYVSPGRTLVEGVREVRPGQLLIVHGERLDERRYWTLGPPRIPRDTSSERRSQDAATSAPLAGRGAETGAPTEALRDAEAAAQLRTLLDEAVRLRVRDEPMLACHLSGGVDSTAVVALARQYTAPRAFTLSFGVDGYDERPLAEATARALGVPLEVIGVDGPTLVETLPEAVARTEGLGINGHLPAKFLLSRAIRGAGLRVCLSGEGADEALLGYPHLRQDLLRAAGAPREHEARLEAANRAAIGVMLADGTQLPTDAVAARLGFVPSWLAAKAALGARTRPLLAEALRHEQRAADPILALVEACAPSGADHPVERASDLWTQTALPRYILSTLGDGAELAYGVEGRVPFLDHPLFAFARGLPLDFKIRSGVEKWVLREALRGLVPDDVVRRPKHPLLAPPLVTTALEPLRELALSSTSALFDRARIERLFDHVAQLPPAERGPWDPPLVMAASASCLEQALGLSEGA